MSNRRPNQTPYQSSAERIVLKTTQSDNVEPRSKTPWVGVVSDSMYICDWWFNHNFFRIIISIEQDVVSSLRVSRLAHDCIEIVLNVVVVSDTEISVPYVYDCFFPISTRSTPIHSVSTVVVIVVLSLSPSKSLLPLSYDSSSSDGYMMRRHLVPPSWPPKNCTKNMTSPTVPQHTIDHEWM